MFVHFFFFFPSIRWLLCSQILDKGSEAEKNLVRAKLPEYFERYVSFYDSCELVAILSVQRNLKMACPLLMFPEGRIY
jgi:hypothetical protein